MQAPEDTSSALGARLDVAGELVRAGQIAEALTALDGLDSDAAAIATSSPADRARLLASTIDCRLARGDLAEAMALADGLAPHLEAGGLAGAFAHHAKGELAAALGDADLAVEHFLEVGAQLGGRHVEPEVLPWQAGVAMAMVRVGRHREATAHAAAFYAEAVGSGSSYAVAQGLRTLATADSGGRRVLLLREARASLEAVVAERLAAQIDTDLAGLLVLSGGATGRAEALGLLRRAEEYAGRQELWPLQGRVRGLLDRLGEPPRRVHSEALASLTSSERRVAALAAQGLTNRQIAEQLVVTIKAVEWHLSHVYRKLGISSRTRLAVTIGAPA